MRPDLDAVSAYTRGRVQRLHAKVSQFGFVKSPPVTVAVLTGLHTDTIIDVDASVFRIGSDIHDDIMLLDPTLHAGGIEFAVDGTIMGSVITVKSEREDVAIDGEPLTDKTTSRRLPCDIDVADLSVRVSVDRSRDVWPTNNLHVGIAAACFAALVAAGLWIEPDTMASGDLTMGVETPEDGTVAPASNLHDALATAITDANLDAYLTLSSDTEDTVRVAGSLPTDRVQAWAQIRRTVDNSSNTGVLLAEVTVIPSLANLPAVAAVKFSVPPVLVLFDDREVGVGDVLSAGWIVDEINEDGFTLSRQDETATLFF